MITCGVLISQLKLREENDGKNQGKHIAGFQERVLPVDKVAYSPNFTLIVAFLNVIDFLNIPLHSLYKDCEPKVAPLLRII